MLVIGLTGGIATGKSTVSKLLEAKKIPLIDADILAREVVAPGTPGLDKIVKTFGPEVLLPDGTLDRQKVGDIVFNDEEKRRKLNAIVHPAVTWAMFSKVINNFTQNKKYCVLDIPLLIEGGLWKWMGMVVVVYCSEEIQLQRLVERNNLSREDALARLNSQLPINDKVPYADVVIDNSGSLKDLEVQIEALVKKLDEERGWRWMIEYFLPPLAVLSVIWVLASRWLRRSWVKKSERKSD